MKLHDLDENQLISEDEFKHLLRLPDYPNLVRLLYGTVKRLSQFPLINHDLEGLTFHGLLKAITLISEERYFKVLTKNYDQLKLLFICLGLQVGDSKEVGSSVEPLSETVALTSGNKISWNSTPIVQSFDAAEIGEIRIPAHELLDFIAFLLVLARLEPQESLSLYSENFTHFQEYKQHALPILRSMNPEITQQNIKQYSIGYDEFYNTITSVAKNLLNPLSSFLEILLFDLEPNMKGITEGTETVSQSTKVKEIRSSSRLVNEFSLSQLSTILRRELVFSNIRKLYVGADSGFSMRSFESKVFKWNAPSIVIIKGTRITPKIHNPRYTKFNEELPRFRKESLASQQEGDKVTYGVYVNQPWRITNKDSFGDEKTEIFQLSPVQKIFKSSVVAKNLIYFNTLGGGIGFGSQQPYIKNNSKRYNPGNVSLTIDASLEFGVFRHLGIGGEFRSVDSRDFNLEYEDRFLISDVEVWGCGGEKELEEQNKRWEWEQREAKRRQHVNLSSMGEDRAILEMAGLIGHHQSGGSV
jgi:hypothetical protein